MLIAGSDVSGNVIDGQHRYIGFVIGKEESINSLHKEIGIKEIHMLKLDEDQKKQVVKNLDFKKHGIKAWCFHVGKQRVIDAIYQHIKLNPKNKRKDKIYQNFDYHLLSYFKKEVEKLTVDFRNLNVQCENDMSNTVKNWKMNPVYKGKAYEFSDAIAWCNEHNRKLKGCTEMNLKDKIFEKMCYDLFK